MKIRSRFLSLSLTCTRNFSSFGRASPSIKLEGTHSHERYRVLISRLALTMHASRREMHVIREPYGIQGRTLKRVEERPPPSIADLTAKRPSGLVPRGWNRASNGTAGRCPPRAFLRSPGGHRGIIGSSFVRDSIGVPVIIPRGATIAWVTENSAERRFRAGIN